MFDVVFLAEIFHTNFTCFYYVKLLSSIHMIFTFFVNILYILYFTLFSHVLVFSHGFHMFCMYFIHAVVHMCFTCFYHVKRTSHVHMVFTCFFHMFFTCFSCEIICEIFHIHFTSISHFFLQ